MRGKASSWIKEGTENRITPAYAGKSSLSFLLLLLSGDHPRMCGEKHAVQIAQIFGKGSPPHVRGKAGVALLSGQIVGITPACAGKSCVVSGRTSQSWDHPRMCGEKTLGGMESHPARGSPPHVRGKVKQLCVLIALRGITPACAGKRSCAPHMDVSPRDHPRMCGEKPRSLSLARP